MARPVIELQNVTKHFDLVQGSGGSMKASAMGMLRRRPKARFTALQDVTFDVQQGETLGVIGHNGAGKSTLLALVAGVMYPSSGTIRTQGRISSLLELGAGFHPDLTGRENVYLYGAVMGIPRRRMRERFEAIVEFAGIGDFIDQPVKHYSSGMYVRLGFAVAVQVEPDILLVDEVLAVGDETFQERCLEHMKAFRESGRTLLIVSHDLDLIQNMSDRIVLLAKGGTRSEGDPKEVVGTYRAAVAAGQAHDLSREWGSGRVKLENVRFLNEAGSEITSFTSGDSLRVQMNFACSSRVDQPVFGYRIADHAGRVIAGGNTLDSGVDSGRQSGRGRVTLDLGSLPLVQGDYLFSFAVYSPDRKIQYHRLDATHSLICQGPPRVEGVLNVASKWRVEND